MRHSQPYTPVTMVRDNLDDFPEHRLPDDYTLKWYEPGDEQRWIDVHLQADQISPIGRELYQETFGNNEEELRRRQLFIVDNHGKSIGTSTAWFNNDYQGKQFGRIHWVAMVPASQGKGLGKILISETCKRIKELGHTRVYLTTADIRLTAVCIYLKFGFKPEIQTKEDLEVWKVMAEKMTEEVKQTLVNNLPS